MAGLGTMMTGGRRRGRGRQAHDWYPTPPDVTGALLDWLDSHLARPKLVWDPACGDGALCRVCAERGMRTIGSDLVDRGYGMAGVDFLTTRRQPDGAIVAADGRIIVPAEAMPATGGPVVITNPPYADRLPERFLLHAAELGIDSVIMLLKSTFWAAACRDACWSEWRPYAILQLTWRPDFLRLGGPTMDVIWCVWIGQGVAETIYDRLPRPVRQRMLEMSS